MVINQLNRIVGASLASLASQQLWSAESPFASPVVPCASRGERGVAGMTGLRGGLEGGLRPERPAYLLLERGVRAEALLDTIPTGRVDALAGLATSADVDADHGRQVDPTGLQPTAASLLLERETADKRLDSTLSIHSVAEHLVPIG